MWTFWLIKTNSDVVTAHSFIPRILDIARKLRDPSEEVGVIRTKLFSGPRGREVKIEKGFFEAMKVILMVFDDFQ